MNALSYLQYGKALYRTALRLKKDQLVFEQLDKLVEAFESKELTLLMHQISSIESIKAEEVLRKAFSGKIDDMIVNLLILLARKRKLSLLKKVYQAYKETFYRATGKQEVILRTARKLSEGETKKYEKLFHDKNENVLVRFETNPDLLSGVQIYERGYITDYSLKNYLETFKKQLLELEAF